MFEHNYNWQSTLVRRLFSCGVDRRVFEASYERLSEDEQIRLERVAKRVWLSLKLRYETAFYASPFAHPDEGYFLTRVELPSIEIYLLCTCLDILAGRSAYKDFGSWLKTQANVTNINLDDVVRLFAQYQAEYGVSRNLRNLFATLPASTKDWLVDNVAIRPWDQPLATRTRDSDVLVKRLHTYFYEIWRNAFTHSGVSRQATRAEDIREYLEGDDWWVTPVSGTMFVLDKDKPTQEWNFSYRQGLDEATILRVIIHSVVLKKLGIEPTPELIAANIRNYSRLNSLYAFINEVNSNATMLKAWSRVDERGMDTLRSFFTYVGIPLLNSEATKLMIDRYNSDNGLESGLRQMTSQYLHEVQTINSAISDFNKSNPPSKTNPSEHWQIVKGFVEERTRTPPYLSIVDWLSRVEMTNLWLVVRDPCYT